MKPLGTHAFARIGFCLSLCLASIGCDAEGQLDFTGSNDLTPSSISDQPEAQSAPMTYPPSVHQVITRYYDVHRADWDPTPEPHQVVLGTTSMVEVRGLHFSQGGCAQGGPSAAEISVTIERDGYPVAGLPPVYVEMAGCTFDGLRELEWVNGVISQGTSEVASGPADLVVTTAMGTRSLPIPVVLTANPFEVSEGDFEGDEEEPHFDEDGDGFATSGPGLEDCDDDNPEVHPEAQEQFNGIDDNCDGEIDEGFESNHDSICPPHVTDSVQQCIAMCIHDIGCLMQCTGGDLNCLMCMSDSAQCVAAHCGEVCGTGDEDACNACVCDAGCGAQQVECTGAEFSCPASDNTEENHEGDLERQEESHEGDLERQEEPSLNEVNHPNSDFDGEACPPHAIFMLEDCVDLCDDDLDCTADCSGSNTSCVECFIEGRDCAEANCSDACLSDDEEACAACMCESGCAALEEACTGKDFECPVNEDLEAQNGIEGAVQGDADDSVCTPHSANVLPGCLVDCASDLICMMDCTGADALCLVCLHDVAECIDEHCGAACAGHDDEACAACMCEADCATQQSECTGVAFECPAPTLDPECMEDADCGPLHLCTEGECVAGDQVECHVNEDCGIDHDCIDFRCVSLIPANMQQDVECTADIDCGPLHLCVEGECIAEPQVECQLDEDCEIGQECAGDRCVPPFTFDMQHAVECTADIDCAPLHVCTEGECIAGPQVECHVNEDCEVDHDCIDHMCISLFPFSMQQDVECTADIDCGLLQVCAEGECIFGIFGAQVECTLDEDCEIGQECAGSRCVSFVPSNMQQDVECTADIDCGPLDQCIDGQCVMASNCDSDFDCPEGTLCVENVCIDGADLACLSHEDCHDQNECTVDRCEPAVGCIHSVIEGCSVISQGQESSPGSDDSTTGDDSMTGQMGPIDLEIDVDAPPAHDDDSTESDTPHIEETPSDSDETQDALEPSVNLDKELIITDLSVIEDPTRTASGCMPNFDEENPNGVWTFKHLIQAMAGDQDPLEFVEAWLSDWATRTEVNGFPVNPAESLETLVIAPWRARAEEAGRGAVLDLDFAPFRLLAIVNRFDLRNDAPEGTAGEGRFVFGLLNASCEPTAAVIIMEFALPAPSEDSVPLWANHWHHLGALEGDAYNEALELVTERFTQADAMPERPNGSAINQIRTNDVIFTGQWTLREFRLNSDGAMVSAPTHGTPDASFNGFASEQLEDTLFGGALVPEETFAGESVVGENWDFGPEVDSATRHHVAVNTCNGCHGQETGTPFLHVSNRSRGQASTLSGFMTGTEVADPFTGELRSFNDLDRRRVDLQSFLADNPEVSI